MHGTQVFSANDIARYYSTLVPEIMVTRQARGFGAVGSAQLTDGFGEIIAHCAFREIQARGDIGARFAFAGIAPGRMLAVPRPQQFAETSSLNI